MYPKYGPNYMKTTHTTKLTHIFTFHTQGFILPTFQKPHKAYYQTLTHIYSHVVLVCTCVVLLCTCVVLVCTCVVFRDGPNYATHKCSHMLTHAHSCSHIIWTAVCMHAQESHSRVAAASSCLPCLALPCLALPCLALPCLLPLATPLNNQQTELHHIKNSLSMQSITIVFALASIANNEGA